MSDSDHMRESVVRFQEMLTHFGVSLEESTARATKLSQRLNEVNLDAAMQWSKAAASWTEETILLLAEINKVKENPAQFAEEMRQCAKAQSQTAVEKMFTFAELAQKVQAETMAIYDEEARDLLDAASKAAEPNKN